MSDQNGTGQHNQGQGNEDQSSEKRFTQTELDSIVEQRLSRDRKTRSGESLKAAKEFIMDRLGIDIENDDEVTLVKSSLEKRDKTASEVNSLKRALTKREEELKTISEQFAQTKTRANQQKIETEIIKHATDAIDPSEVVLLLSNQFGVDDDGTMFVRGANGESSTKTIQQTVKDFLNSKPHLVRPKIASGGAGSKPTDGSAKPPPDKKYSLEPDPELRAQQFYGLLKEITGQ